MLNAIASGSKIYSSEIQGPPISDTTFTTEKDVETTKTFLLNGQNWCYILPTAPPGCVIKNETE
jgi:hypothetical protein